MAVTDWGDSQSTQFTSDGAVTAVWKTAVQIVSTPPSPSNGGPIYQMFSSLTLPLIYSNTSMPPNHLIFCYHDLI